MSRLQNLLELARYVRPGETRVDHLPSRGGLPAALLLIVQQFDTLSSEGFRCIGYSNVFRGVDLQSLCAYCGRHYRDPGSHGFVDLQSSASSNAERHDRDCRTPKIRTDIRNASGHLYF